MLTGQELEKGMSMLKMIWGALAVSLLMYIFIAPMILETSQVNFPPDAYATLRMSLYGVAFATLAATWFVRKIILTAKSAPRQTKSRQHPAIQRYTTAMIIALAMSEAIGIYGLILFLLGKNQFDLYLLTALSAAAMTLYFPKKEEVISLSERF
jgi:F0F1-type ATP synthase membrane subunit c/vacuolar-type H+-ATPase subunit K